MIGIVDHLKMVNAKNGENSSGYTSLPSKRAIEFLMTLNGFGMSVDNIDPGIPNADYGKKKLMSIFKKHDNDEFKLLEFEIKKNAMGI
jgi:hypothetical protein